jgi:hypothetical protein
MRSSFNRQSDFDRKFNLMGRVFWVFFAVVAMLIFGQIALMGWAGYQLVTNPEAVGTIAADVIRPVAEAIKGE